MEKKKEMIKVKNLVKKFGDFTAVNGINFEVEEGEIFGLLGPNGAGKTTTLSMLATLLEITTGEAYVNDFDVATKRDEVRKSIGIVFQDPTLDDELTAYENLDFHGRLYGVPLAEREKKIAELLKLVELESKKNLLVKNFSGGMKRRLEIARSLLHEPKVLFLDEPTLGLDPQTRNKLWEYIKNLNKKKGVTVILTTHYMEEADSLCNRIAIIDHGNIIISGSPDDLRDQIGGDVITVETEDGVKLEKVIKGCKGCKSVKHHDGSVTINVDNASKKISEIVELVNHNKIKATSFVMHKPSLEDVFLHYTGKTIREEESSPIEHMRLRRRMWHGGGK